MPSVQSLMVWQLRRDTAFVVQDEDQPGMQGPGMLIRLLFSFTDYEMDELECGQLIQWAFVKPNLFYLGGYRVSNQYNRYKLSKTPSECANNANIR